MQCLQRSEFISCRHPLLLYLIIRNSHIKQKSFQSQLSPTAVAIHHPSSTCVMWNCALTPSPSRSSRPACFQQLWFISSLMSRQAGKSPLLVAPFSCQRNKKSPNWLFQKKIHLAAEHPAVSLIDPEVSPSLQHRRTTYVQKQVHLQSLRGSRSLCATCYMFWNETFTSKIK